MIKLTDLLDSSFLTTENTQENTEKKLRFSAKVPGATFSSERIGMKLTLPKTDVQKEAEKTHNENARTRRGESNELF